MGESGHPPSNVYRLGEDAERAEDARGHPCLSVCLTQLCLSLRWNFHKIASSDDFTIAASKPSVLLAVRMNAKSRLVRRKCFGKRGKLNFGCPKEVRPPAEKLRLQEENRSDHVGERIHSVKRIAGRGARNFTPWVLEPT